MKPKRKYINASGECTCAETPYTRLFKTKCLFADDCEKCCKRKIAYLYGWL